MGGHLGTQSPVELSARNPTLQVCLHARVVLSAYHVGRHLNVHVNELGS